MASRRENALDLAKFVDNGVRVKLSGGREGEGERGGGGGRRRRNSLLPPRSPTPSLSPPPPHSRGRAQGLRPAAEPGAGRGGRVFARCEREGKEGPAAAEVPPHHAHPPSLPFSDKDDLLRVTDATRPLGLCVLRGTAVMAVAPTAGAERLAANPFAGAEEAG